MLEKVARQSLWTTDKHGPSLHSGTHLSKCHPWCVYRQSAEAVANRSGLEVSKKDAQRQDLALKNKSRAKWPSQRDRKTLHFKVCVI